MVLDPFLLNTQHYKVCRSNPGKIVPSLHLSVVVIEKGALGCPGLESANLYIYIYILDHG